MEVPTGSESGAQASTLQLPAPPPLPNLTSKTLGSVPAAFEHKSHNPCLSVHLEVLNPEFPTSCEWRVADRSVSPN